MEKKNISDLIKRCSNCKYSNEISADNVFTTFCLGQKGAPVVDPNDICENWKPIPQTNDENGLVVVSIPKDELRRLVPHPLWWDVKKMSYICPVCNVEYYMPKDADLILDFSDKLHYCMECGTKLEGVKDVY